MSKKIIGIPGYKNSNGESFGAGISHLSFLSTFGNVRIIMPWEEKVDVDLLYLPGGLDLSPSKYGEVPHFRSSNHDVFKEFFLENRLQNYVGNTPIFGVCLGMQSLAVYFGSILTQDFIYHEQSKSRWETAHKIYGTWSDRDGTVHKKQNVFEVNSHHHQGVTIEGLNKDLLQPLYVSENEDRHISGENFIVEAFSHKEYPIVGVQWHPEELYDEFTISIIKKFLV